MLHDFIRSYEPPGGFHIPMATSRVRQSVAHEVDAATLPAGVENLVLVGGRRRRREGCVDLEETEYPLPRTSRRPSVLTPTATIAATRTMHPCWLALHLGGVDPQIWPVALDRTIRLSPCSSTSVRSFMISSIIGGSSVALACRNPILPANRR